MDQSFLEKLIAFIGGIIAKIGAFVTPVMRYIDSSEHASVLKIGGAVLLIVLGIIFVAHSFSQFSKRILAFSLPIPFILQYPP